MAYVAPDFPLNDSKPIAPSSRILASPALQAPGIAPALVAFRERARTTRCQSFIVTGLLSPRVAALVAVAAVCSSTHANAHARADLQGIEVSDVHEAEHTVSIRIEGLIASIESRQVVVNQGDRDTEIFYTFDLPLEAAVTGVEIRLPDGRRAVSTAIDAAAAFKFVEDEESPGRPDVGLLRLVDRPPGGDEQIARYQLRVFPVLAGKSAVAVVRWHVPVRYRDGRLELRLPARGSAANRVRERVDVTWRAPTSSRGVRDVRAGGNIAAAGAALVSKARLTFIAPPDADIVLEARPVFRGGTPIIAELATRGLDKTGGAYALTVISPSSTDTRPTAYERVLFIIDTSRSLGTTGIAAARSVADALLDAATPAAQTGAIVFARHARPISARLSADRSGLEKGLAKALSEGGTENGSDLGDALDQAAALLKRAGPTASTPLGGVARGSSDSTLIVVITDSVLPLGLDGAQAASRIGSIAINEARVASVVLVPDRAPLPDPYDGPLGELARRTGGRIVTVRHGEAGTRAPGLWSELAQPAPIREIDVDWRGASVTGDDQVPAQLEAGEGVVLFGWYRGRAPSSVTIGADLHGGAVSARVRRGGGVAAKTALALALVNRPAGEVPRAVAAKDADDVEAARALAAAVRAGVATTSASLVVLDTADGFARDRLALARKWGPSQYRRFPPPSERSAGEAGAPDARPVIGRSAPPSLRRTGELDRGIIQRLMKHHVVPRARACYDRALRRAPDLAGSVTVELEMVRGEVQEARISRTTITDAALTECLLDAAYATPVPNVALGDTSEVVVVARYPLRLRRIQKRPEVSPGVEGRSTDPDDPLGGLDP